MNGADAQKVALGVFLVVTAVVAWDSLKKTGKPLPPFKSVVALLVLGAGLMIGVDIAPSVVGPLSLLIGLSVVVSRVGAPSSKPTGKGLFSSLYTK